MSTIKSSIIQKQCNYLGEDTHAYNFTTLWVEAGE